MQIYFCWITVLLPEVQDDIISGMARKGYMVGPMSKDGKVISAPGANPAGSIVAISVYRQVNIPTAKMVYDDLVKILNDTHSYYYSVIVAAATEATWAGANFQLPARKSAPPPLPEPTPVPDKNLN